MKNDTLLPENKATSSLELEEITVESDVFSSTEITLEGDISLEKAMPIQKKAPISTMDRVLDSPAKKIHYSAVIGPKISFKGELSGDEDLLIEGSVEGSIRLTGSQLTIGEQGKVKADLSAKNIIINGHVEGSLVAEQRITINEPSTVKASVTANRVTIEDGAKFKGSIEMDIE